MYIDPSWQKSFPENDFKGAVTLLNSLDWNLSVNSSTDKWLLFGGEKLIASFNTQEELEVFCIGMAFSFAVLPGEVIDHIQEIIRD